MKKPISQNLVVTLIVVVVVLVGVFGWYQLRSSSPRVTPQETKAAQQSQMDSMKDAMQRMRNQQGTR